MAEERYIRPVDAAAELKVTPQAVYKWIREGRLKAERFGIIRGLRIPVEDWERFKAAARGGREPGPSGHRIAPELAAA